MRFTIEQLYAQLYDLSVPDWPGEITFYRELVMQTQARGQAVLELACGTGRVALQLAQSGIPITGLDLSPELLEIAQQKSQHLPHVRWVQGNMREFDLGQTFGLVIIPGHSFQFMLTPDDQVLCLESIKRHLTPDGVLVVHLDHQDVGWLGDLLDKEKGVFSVGRPIQLPQTGQWFRTSHAWTYAPATQTASVTTIWEELDEAGQVVDRWQREPMALHCIFRFEMAHLLARAGFQVEAVYGDFYKQPLTDESEQMVWVARQ